MSRCLYCYQALEMEEKDFHPACSKKIFGQFGQPELDLSEKGLHSLALNIIQSQISVTGVQPKLLFNSGF